VLGVSPHVAVQWTLSLALCDGALAGRFGFEWLDMFCACLLARSATYVAVLLPPERKEGQLLNTSPEHLAYVAAERSKDYGVLAGIALPAKAEVSLAEPAARPAVTCRAGHTFCAGYTRLNYHMMIFVE
jgi:hypothetical protein